MNLPAYLRLLAVLLCLGTSLIAQTLPAPSNKMSDLPVIPLDEAEQHLIERTQPIYPPLATGDSGYSIMEMGRRHAEVPEETIHRDRIMKLLVDAGADIDTRGWFGETALFSLQ